LSRPLTSTTMIRSTPSPTAQQLRRSLLGSEDRENLPPIADCKLGLKLHRDIGPGKQLRLSATTTILFEFPSRYMCDSQRCYVTHLEKGVVTYRTRLLMAFKL
jgi:hypothetical protein